MSTHLDEHDPELACQTQSHAEYNEVLRGAVALAFSRGLSEFSPDLYIPVTEKEWLSLRVSGACRKLTGTRGAAGAQVHEKSSGLSSALSQGELADIRRRQAEASSTIERIRTPHVDPGLPRRESLSNGSPGEMSTSTKWLIVGGSIVVIGVTGIVGFGLMLRASKRASS